DQRLGVGPDDLGDAADVPPGVEVATTGRVVVVLDAPDDRFPDTGPLADLGNGESGPVARFRQGFTDDHAAPPLLCRTAHRAGGGVRRSCPHHGPRLAAGTPIFAAGRADSNPGRRVPPTRGAGPGSAPAGGGRDRS